MINDDQNKTSLLNRNRDYISYQRNTRNNKEKELERINRSQRVNTNHFVYCSKYSNVRNTSYRAKENDKSNKTKNLIDDEGLDHPIPLISDSEENFEELKAQFINKKEKYENINNNSKRKKRLKNLKKLEDTTGTYLTITSKEVTDLNEHTVETNKNNEIEDNNISKKCIILCKKNENDLGLNYINHNKPKTQIILRNQKCMNKSLNIYNNNKENEFKMSHNTNKNRIIIIDKNENEKNLSTNKNKHIRQDFQNILGYMDKKEKQNLQYPYENNKLVPEINSYNHLNYGDKNGNQKFQRFNTINNKLNILKKEKILEKIDVENISDNCIKKGHERSKNKNLNYNKIDSDSKENLYLKSNLIMDNKKLQLINRVKSEYPQKRKIIKNENENENENDKSNWKILFTESDIKTKSFLNNQYNLKKNKDKKNNQFNIFDKKDLSTNNESQTNGMNGERKLVKLNSYKYSKNQNLLNNYLNRSNYFSNLNTSDLQTPILKKKHTIFSKQKSGNENSSNFRLKSFENNENLNNIQTTFIVISKNTKKKPATKSKLVTQIINDSKIKFPIQSANNQNNSKFLKRKSNPIYSEYLFDIKDRRTIGNENRNLGVTKSVNNMSVKHHDYKKDLSCDKKIRHSNHINYFDYPIINNSRKNLYGSKDKRVPHLINTSK